MTSDSSVGARVRGAIARWFVAGVVVVGVTSCGVGPAPTIERLDLVVGVPITGGQLEIVRPADAVSVTPLALQEDVFVRSATIGDRVHVAWVGPVAVAGPQLRFEIERLGEATEESLVIVSGGAFDGEGGNDLGVGIFAWSNTTRATLSAEPTGPTPSPYPTNVGLEPSFVDRPLGDVNDDGALDVRDAISLWRSIEDQTWTDYRRFHADLDADDAAGPRDIEILLERLVDATLPAELHVKPRSLSFVALDPATDQDAIVLIANRGRLDFPNLGWNVPTGVTVQSMGGTPGASAALRWTLPAANRIGWQPGLATIRDGAGGDVAVRVGHLVLLVAGQSNASGRGYPLLDDPAIPSVRMLANDYRWKVASEPLDDPAGQLDEVSLDTSDRYSFGTRLGKLLYEASGFDAYLIPAALGGSGLDVWLPSADVYDRRTLFGSAHVRARVSAGLTPNPQVNVLPYEAEGGPVNAIVWYQGESDANTDTKRNLFIARTDQVMDRFEVLVGAPMVYVQLASHRDERDHERQLLIAELQRRMETGSGFAAASPERFMVVAFDLPRSDQVHLSAYGQRVLAERIQLAVREHVLDEDVDGTGPRLVAVEHVESVDVRRIDISTTHELSGSLDRRHFRVFDGPPNGDVDGPTSDYGTNALSVASVTIDPNDARVVRVTLAADPPVGSDLFVSYWALPNLSEDPSTWDVLAPGVIRAAVGDLPLPAFGPIAAQ